MAVFLFARPAASHFATSYVGRGVDQPFFIWCLVWWPYALVHHLNPFVTRLIFAPAGLNLTWTTPIPLLSLLAWPLTRALGPVATYNLLCVICPALAAWTAFLLCRYLTAAFWSSLIGGYLFGFSAYVLGHVLGGHPDCFAVFLVPLIVRPGAGEARRAGDAAILRAVIFGAAGCAVSDRGRIGRDDDGYRRGGADSRMDIWE